MMVKICGITNVEDALAAAEGGATALGFNFWPRSPRYIAPEAARRVIERLPRSLWKAGVFVDQDRGAVAEVARATGIDIVQLHGHEAARDFPDGVRVWKAVRIGENFDAAALDEYPAEAILLDGPSSGVTFDWSLAARETVYEEPLPHGRGSESLPSRGSKSWLSRDRQGAVVNNYVAPRKIIIAGGLGVDNVRQAIEQTRPWGVDACSRLESAPGKKDHVRMAEFLKAALTS